MNFIRFVTALSLLTSLTACERAGTSTGQEGAPAIGTVTATSLALTVDATGYHPDSLSGPAGHPIRLSVTRTSDDGCGQQIVFPSLNIRRDLPLNRPVTIDFAMPATGTVAFTCGMGMLRGSLIAQ